MLPNLRAGKRELLKLPILDLRERAFAPLEVSLHQEADFQGSWFLKMFCLPVGSVLLKEFVILIPADLRFDVFSSNSESDSLS